MNKLTAQAVLALQETPDDDQADDADVAGHGSTVSLAACASSS